MKHLNVFMYRLSQFSPSTSREERFADRVFKSDMLMGKSSRCVSYLNEEYMKQVIHDHMVGKANHEYLINSLLVFELWLRAFRV